VDIDMDQLKRASLAAIQRRREYNALRGPHGSEGLPRRVNQPTIGQRLRSRLAQGRLDVDKLARRLPRTQSDRRLARTQSELHELFQQQQKDAAAYLASDETAFRAGVQRKLRDFGHFPASVTPLTVTRILLDKPFMILQLPKSDLDVFDDSHLESGNSPHFPDESKVR
jgi:hypothetical protein